MAEEQNRTLQDKFMLRLPEGMREQLKSWASKSGRSLNAEIVHRLANSLENPRFSDFALGLGGELDDDLMISAAFNNRSLHEEMIYRLKQTLTPETTLIGELERKAWDARQKYDEIMKLFIQLTPEERRLLEERSEIMDYAKREKVKAKNIGEFVRLNPIGGRGRVILTQPKSDYSPIVGSESKNNKTPISDMTD